MTGTASHIFDNFLDGAEVVICLYDNRYHYGVAALANSLCRSNFKGIIHVGYKDVLPPWLNQLQFISYGNYYLTKDIIISFKYIQIDMHLAYYKPYFIKETINNYPLALKFFYFDADIVVNATWSFFSNWANNNVCLCLDNSFDFVDSNHPWREDWKKLANMEHSKYNPTTFYVNSGFIGINTNNVPLISKWIELTESYNKWGGDIKEIDQRGHNSYKGDQDLLNAAITVSPEIVLSIIGKEGMGFKQPAYLMSHAIAKIKPWDKNYLIYLLKSGHKPTYDEKNFFFYCKYPISLFSQTEFFFKKTNLRIAAFLGRYIGY